MKAPERERKKRRRIEKKEDGWSIHLSFLLGRELSLYLPERRKIRRISSRGFIFLPFFKLVCNGHSDLEINSSFVEERHRNLQVLLPSVHSMIIYNWCILCSFTRSWEGGNIRRIPWWNTKWIHILCCRWRISSLSFSQSIEFIHSISSCFIHWGRSLSHSNFYFYASSRGHSWSHRDRILLRKLELLSSLFSLWKQSSFSYFVISSFSRLEWQRTNSEINDSIVQLQSIWKVHYK